MGCGASKSAAGESVSGKSAVGQDVGDRLAVLEKKLVAEQLQREALEERLFAEVLQRTALEERLAAVDAQRIRGDDVLAEESLPGNLNSSTAAVLAAVEQTLKDQLAEAEARSQNETSTTLEQNLVEEEGKKESLENETDGEREQRQASGEGLLEDSTVEETLAEDSFSERDRTSARCFAHHYARTLSASRRSRVVQPRKRAGASVLEGQADDGQQHGFPAGGLSALQNDRERKGPRGHAGKDGDGKPAVQILEWWYDCEYGGDDGKEVEVEKREQRSLSRSYRAHFQDLPPRCRPALREIARKKEAKKKAAEAKAVAGMNAGTKDRNIPFPADKHAAIIGISGGVGEQALDAMQLEESVTDDVTVVARVRPFLAGEGNDRGLRSEGETVQVDSSDIGNPGRQFCFDTVVEETEDSEVVFQQTGKPAAKEIARGVSAVVFAFGQTGSGKTYTLLGGKGQDGAQKEGVASMSYDAMRKALDQRAEEESGSERGAVEYTIECSILQVYLGGVYDLLGDDCETELRMRSHVKVRTLKDPGGETCELFPRETILPCRDAREFTKVLEKGIGKRAVRGTKMNATSSRSHCIVTLLVKRKVRLERADSSEGGVREYFARLVFVDLAGNERDSARDGVEDGALLQAEGIDVNMSLTTLSSLLRMRSEGKVQVGGVSRISALTRLLREPLTCSKIFFVACVSPLKSAAITSAQTLAYAALVKKIKTNAENSAVLFERGHRFPIEFIPHTSLIDCGKIARSSEEKTVYLKELRAVVIKVFVSHRWLSPSSTPSTAHPDMIEQGHPKHLLVCRAIEKMIDQGWIRSSDMVDIVDWIDFACINQDSDNPAQQLNGSMGRIIGSCDVMITPVHDPDWEDWCNDDDGCQIEDVFKDYCATPFQDYLKRGWCRLEMFFNANVPFDYSRRAKLFDAKLKEVMVNERRRPHLIYGTRELELGLEPCILRKLKDHEFRDYHPAEGHFFNDDDAYVIDDYVKELIQMNKSLSEYGDLELIRVERLRRLEELKRKEIEEEILAGKRPKLDDMTSRTISAITTTVGQIAKTKVTGSETLCMHFTNEEGAKQIHQDGIRASADGQGGGGFYVVKADLIGKVLKSRSKKLDRECFLRCLVSLYGVDKAKEIFEKSPDDAIMNLNVLMLIRIPTFFLEPVVLDESDQSRGMCELHYISRERIIEKFDLDEDDDSELPPLKWQKKILGWMKIFSPETCRSPNVSIDQLFTP